MPHIFISYSRRDIDFAQKIVTALAENNLDTWIDWKSIPKGEKWLEEIYRGIEGADAFLFLISPDSVISDNCSKEIEHAVKNNKRIIPVVVRDADSKAIPGAVSERNWIFCRYEEGKPDITIDHFGAAIEEIQKTVHTDYEWLKYHTSLQVKALDWQRTNDNSRLLRGKELREAEGQLSKIGNQADPQPTSLQREYIYASAKHEERQRRQLISGLSIGIVIMTFLSIFAWGQRNSAVNAQNTAIVESIFRATAQKQAELEANARATALVNEENARVTAQAERNRAEEQARLARARELAAQAQLLSGQQAGTLYQSTLLAVESLKLSPSPAAVQFLRQAINLLPPSIPLRPDGRVLYTVLSPDERLLLTTTETQAIVWDVENGKERNRFDIIKSGESPPTNPLLEPGDIFGGAFSPDNQRLAILYGTDTVQFRDIATGELLGSIHATPPVIKILFSPDGQYAAIVHDTLVSVVAMSSLERISTLNHDGKVTSAVFSPDSKRLATAYLNLVQVWDISSGRTMAVLSHEGNVNDLVFRNESDVPE